MKPRHKPGDRLQRYRIEQVLGEGGQGVVYLAQHEALGAPVAIKELFEGDRQTREHFLWQARVLVRLSHPVLPRVTDFFTVGEYDYLVMEYIEGEDLYQRVRRLGAQDVRQVMIWAEQLLDGLHYLHSITPQPIIHRDLKPANLKITSTGKIYLVDFGLAKVGGSDHSTRLGARGYTEGFSPPEQYGGAHTDARSDLYALGATLYFLLAGVNPAEANLRASGVERMQPLRALNPTVSAEVEAWIAQAMAVVRDQRWPSAAVMRQAMPALRGGGSGRIPTNPPLPPPPISNQPRRGQSGPATAPRTGPRPKRTKGEQVLVYGLVAVFLLLMVGGSAVLGILLFPDGGQGGTPSEKNAVTQATQTQEPTPPTNTITATPTQPSASTPTSTSFHLEGIPTVVIAPSSTARPTLTLSPTPTRPPATATSVTAQVTLVSTSVPQVGRSNPQPPPTNAASPTSIRTPVPVQNVTLTLLNPEPNGTTSDRLVSFQVRAHGYQVGTHQIFILMGTDPNNPTIPASLTRSNFSNGVWIGDVTSPPGNFGTWYWTARVIDNQGTIIAQASDVRRFEWNAPPPPRPAEPHTEGEGSK